MVGGGFLFLPPAVSELRLEESDARLPAIQREIMIRNQSIHMKRNQSIHSPKLDLEFMSL